MENEDATVIEAKTKVAAVILFFSPFWTAISIEGTQKSPIIFTMKF